MDLDLGKFDLSSPMHPSDINACCSELDSLEGQTAIGSAFLECLEGGFEDTFEDRHSQLLKDVFNPYLCDRATEGACFVPPDTRYEYIHRLKNLVQDEANYTQQRKEFFQMADFKIESPGDMFPMSWTCGYEISRAKKGSKQVRDLEVGSLQPGMLVSRPDYKEQAVVFEHMLKTSTPIFDKMDEGGTRFRIYRCGSIEVRTTQERDQDETICVVYNIRAPEVAGKKPGRSVSEDEKVVKVTQFVERNPLDTSGLTEKFMPSRRYYVMAKTDAGNTIVTERLKDGTITFQENPKDLHDRNSLAKTVRSKAGQFETTLADLKLFQSQELNNSNKSCKKYAYHAYDLAIRTPETMETSEESSSRLTAPTRVPQKSVREQLVMQRPKNDQFNVQLFMKAQNLILPSKGQNDDFNKQLLKQSTNRNVVRAR